MEHGNKSFVCSPLLIKFARTRSEPNLIRRVERMVSLITRVHVEFRFRWSSTNWFSTNLKKIQRYKASFEGFQDLANCSHTAVRSSKGRMVIVIFFMSSWFWITFYLCGCLSRRTLTRVSFNKRSRWACFQKQSQSVHVSPTSLIFAIREKIVSSVYFCSQDANYASSIRQKILTIIQACEQL